MKKEISEYFTLRFKDIPVEEAAVKNNCMVDIPSSKELFIDIDSEADMDRFYSVLGMFAAKIGIESYVIGNSRSCTPGKYHIRVRLLHEIDDLTRVLFQTILGSDPKRELLSYMRIKNNIVPVTAFLEKKKEE